MAAVVAYIFAPIKSIIGFFQKKKPDRRDTLAETAVNSGDNSPVNTGGGVQTVAETASVTVNNGLSVSEFLAIRRELKADLEKELAKADQSEKEQLCARIAELERQIANPDQALKEAQKRIEDLEALLKRSGNQIGTERVNEARAALERGDFSIADEIFAEIEAGHELNIQEAARAAYGRGEIAEEEVRWADAAKHYLNAARLDPTYDTLLKAQDFAERSGDYTKSLQLGEDLIDKANAQDDKKKLTAALNTHAITLKQLGRLEEAEALYRQAIEIDKATIGEDHPNYAIHLNNLAIVMRAQGQFEEAEELYRQVIEIDKSTIGEDHPDYAISLNNLAVAAKAQNRFEEADSLYQQALEIGETTIGEAHPDYAIRLNNLAIALQSQGRVEEAEALYRQTIEIAEARLGPEHPTTRKYKANLDRLLAQKPED